MNAEINNSVGWSHGRHLHLAETSIFTARRNGGPVWTFVGTAHAESVIITPAGQHIDFDTVESLPQPLRRYAQTFEQYAIETA